MGASRGAWEPSRTDDARSPAARRVGVVVIAVAVVVVAWLTLRGHGERGEERRSVAMRALREGLDARDPAVIASARDGFLRAATGAWVQSEGLLLASLAEELRARVAGDVPAGSPPGGGDRDVGRALDLLAGGRYEEARSVLADAVARTPDSPVLRFHAGVVAELLALGSEEHPQDRQIPPMPVE